MQYRPQISQASRPLTFTVDAVNEHNETIPTEIAGESPLTLYLDKREIVTLMTLGAAPEALAIGYLRNQRLLTSIEQIHAVQVDWETEAVAVTTRNGVKALDKDTRKRLGKRTVTTGCGQGTSFGDLMEDIDNTRLPQDVTLDEATLQRLLDNVRTYDSLYKKAGALHGCALASNSAVKAGEIIYYVEDVGRHNAVDAIAGMMWLDEVSGEDKIFYTTGRLTSEMVIKAAQMRVPFLVSRSGLTRMGLEVANRVGMTMIGRSQGRHFLIFTGAQHFRYSAEQSRAQDKVAAA
jgi:FdhD protein